jgi:hypothetical protein
MDPCSGCVPTELAEKVLPDVGMLLLSELPQSEVTPLSKQKVNASCSCPSWLSALKLSVS